MFGDSKQVNKAEIVVADGDNGVLCLHGRIDIDSAPALREGLLALLRSPHPKIVGIDLSAVNHLDSSGVATLIEVLRIARAHRTELRLQGLHDRLLRLFESTGILDLFNMRIGAQSRHEAE